MDEQEIGIQPCCIDKKLPPLLERGRELTFFHSQGDWGLEKLWHALTAMVASQPVFDENNKIVKSETFTLLTLRTANEYTLRFIRKYMEKHWIQALCLVLADKDKDEMVKAELQGFEDRICYVGGRREAEDCNVWIRSTDEQTLVITGPVDIGEGNGRFCQYTGSYTHNQQYARQAFEPFRRILRLKAVMKGSDPLLDKWLNNK